VGGRRQSTKSINCIIGIGGRKPGITGTPITNKETYVKKLKE
jgi:hypothetical protein